MRIKIQFVILMFCLIPVLGFTQKSFHKGIKLSFTSSNLSCELLQKSLSRRSGFSVGLFFEVNTGNIVSLVTQLEYAQKGFIESQEEINERLEFIQTVKANTRLDYLSIPVFLKFKIPNLKFEPYFIGGPRFDYLFNKKYGIFQFTNSTSMSKLADYFKKTVFGATIGGGIKLPELYQIQTSVEFRYNHDFTDLLSELENSAVIKNNSWDLSLGINF